MLEFGHPLYQFAKPTTELSIENVFDAVRTLTHKRVKFLSQQIPFINTTITGHSLLRADHLAQLP